jgi:hypothetical protein
MATPANPAASKAPAPAPAPEVATESDVEAPVVELVSIGGLVIEKTMYPDGECETRTVREPAIAPELVRSTRASQRRQGH